MSNFETPEPQDITNPMKIVWWLLSVLTTVIILGAGAWASSISSHQTAEEARESIIEQRLSVIEGKIDILKDHIDVLTAAGRAHDDAAQQIQQQSPHRPTR